MLREGLLQYWWMLYRHSKLLQAAHRHIPQH